MLIIRKIIVRLARMRKWTKRKRKKKVVDLEVDLEVNIVITDVTNIVMTAPNIVMTIHTTDITNLDHLRKIQHMKDKPPQQETPLQSESKHDLELERVVSVINKACVFNQQTTQFTHFTNIVHSLNNQEAVLSMYRDQSTFPVVLSRIQYNPCRRSQLTAQPVHQPSPQHLPSSANPPSCAYTFCTS